MNLLIFLLLLHHEGYFFEHSIKTAFGTNVLLSDYKNEKIRSQVLLITPFLEYSIKGFFSIRGDFPFAYFAYLPKFSSTDKRFLLSDISLTAKFSPLKKVVHPTLLISFDFPTGSSLATANHYMVTPAIAVEIHLPVLHIHSLLGYHRELGGSGESDSEHQTYQSHNQTNYAIPHTGNEIMGHIGGAFSLLPFLMFDGRIHFNYEDMKTLSLGPQIGPVFDVDVGVLSLKSSLYLLYYFSGVREGLSLGGYIYMEF